MLQIAITVIDKNAILIFSKIAMHSSNVTSNFPNKNIQIKQHPRETMVIIIKPFGKLSLLFSDKSFYYKVLSSFLISSNVNFSAFLTLKKIHTEDHAIEIIPYAIQNGHSGKLFITTIVYKGIPIQGHTTTNV